MAICMPGVMYDEWCRERQIYAVHFMWQNDGWRFLGPKRGEWWRGIIKHWSNDGSWVIGDQNKSIRSRQHPKKGFCSGRTELDKIKLLIVIRKLFSPLLYTDQLGLGYSEAPPQVGGSCAPDCVKVVVSRSGVLHIFVICSSLSWVPFFSWGSSLQGSDHWYTTVYTFSNSRSILHRT